MIAAPHKVRVKDSATAKALAARGAKVIGDYGGFTAVEADDALLAGLDSNRIDVLDGWNMIRLNARPLDTRTAQVKALRHLRGQFAGKQLHLVQFAGPIKPEWLDALKQSGAQIVSYIPENAYLIYGDSPALAKMQSWAGASDFVQWEGEYTHDLKIHPKARAVAAVKGQGRAPAYAFSIQLLVDPSANAATLALIEKLQTAPAESDYQLDEYRNLVVWIPADQLDTVAAQPDVISIQPYVAPKKRDERQDQIVAGNISGGQPTGPGYLSWLASKGFTQEQFDASGFIVDMTDSGIDDGTTTPGHFGLYSLGDTTKSSRVAYNRFEGTAHRGGTLAGCDGHGTLNAHIVANFDNYGGFQHMDNAGYSYGMGVCPFVKIGSSVIFDNSGVPNDFTRPNLSTMLSDSYKSGARIVNNSWGSDVGGDYDASSQAYDKLVRDSEATAAGNQEMVIVFAAGNAGPCATNSPTTLGIDSPGSAKNVITVGASENVRSLSIANGGNDPDGNDDCELSDADANDANSMNCSSSQGPCSDGRMKPDLVAPGIHITGGAPQELPPSSPSSLGAGLSCFDAFGVCALFGSGSTENATNFFPLGQQFYTESSGTSHATPAVSGACALIRQFFINNSLTPPSAAMTKAVLLNSARYMTGSGANDTLWSPAQGMGELNLGMAFDDASRFLRDQVANDMFTASGQVRVFGGTVTDPSKPFRVTLAWTDAPGTTSSAAYKNDLDLTVTVGGNTYKGNVFNGQFSTIGGSADNKNNVESVFLPAGVTGDFGVTITAANINSAGVPNGTVLSRKLNQDFALVVYNGSATNVPTFSPAVASYNGLFFEAAGAELGRSGAVSLKTTASGSYSGKLQIGSASYAFTGAFNTFGQATNMVVRKGASTLTLVLNVNLNNNDEITGSVNDPDVWSADLRAEETSFNAKTAPAPLAGAYTLLFPGTNGDALLPGGSGYATVSMDTSGKIKMAGSLADGTKISQSAVAANDGEWPFYISLYSGQGQILGWLQFTSAGPEFLGGDVDWTKSPMDTAKVYPGGFDFETHAIGSTYNPAALPLIGFSNGLVILGGANLTDTIVSPVGVNGSTISNQGTNKLTLKFTASKGTFTGSVVDPASSTTIKFNGAYLQSQAFGLGYFIGGNQSGSVSFGPGD